MAPGVPEALVDHRASGLLELRWPDGRSTRLAHALLRASCRCAACEQQRRRGGAPAPDPAVRLAQIRPVSDQGVNLVFDDGHGRGIYPWAYLQQLQNHPWPPPEPSACCTCTTGTTPCSPSAPPATPGCASTTGTS